MSESKQILYITFNMPWQGGGTFYRAFGFGKQLVKMGHQVTILATDIEKRWGTTEEIVDGVKIVTAPSLLTGKIRTGWDPYEILWRCAWLRGKRFDIVHTFETRPTVVHPALYVIRQGGGQLFFDWCDWFGRGGIIEERDKWTKLILSPIETFYEERFRLRAVGTTVINTALEKRAVALGVEPDSLYWLPNGTSIEQVLPLDKTDSRAKVGLPTDDTPLIGYLGHAFDRDAKLLGDAFALLKQQMPQAKLVVIGGYRGTIPQHIPNQEDLTVTGYVSLSDMNAYLCACDLLWLPLSDTLANRGRWPMKINDYMCSGRPTVSTNVGDWTRLFAGDRPIGLLSTDEPQSLADQTAVLLADPTQAAVYGENARGRAETEFDWAIVTERLNRFYQERARSEQPDG